MLPLLVAPSAPRNVAAGSATSSSITWRWDPPANHGNKVTYYRMSNGATIRSTSGTYYQWSGLSGYSQYKFRVQAVTGSGNRGSWSSWRYYRTLPASMPGTHIYSFLPLWVYCCI